MDKLFEVYSEPATRDPLISDKSPYTKREVFEALDSLHDADIDAPYDEIFARFQEGQLTAEQAIDQAYSMAGGAILDSEV